MAKEIVKETEIDDFYKNMTNYGKLIFLLCLVSDLNQSDEGSDSDVPVRESFPELNFLDTGNNGDETFESMHTSTGEGNTISGQDKHNNNFDTIFETTIVRSTMEKNNALVFHRTVVFLISKSLIF